MGEPSDVCVVEVFTDPASPGRGSFHLTSIDQSRNAHTLLLGEHDHLFDNDWHIICFSGRPGRYG